MHRDRRQTERYAVSGLVLVQNGTGAPPRECRLTNISDGGVRLYVDTIEIAEEFTLWLPTGGTQRRRCRVMWRLGPELGAQFIDPLPASSARHLAGGCAAG